jgi:hypothetical protein
MTIKGEFKGKGNVEGKESAAERFLTSFGMTIKSKCEGGPTEGGPYESGVSL